MNALLGEVLSFLCCVTFNSTISIHSPSNCKHPGGQSLGIAYTISPGHGEANFYPHIQRPFLYSQQQIAWTMNKHSVLVLVLGILSTTCQDDHKVIEISLLEYKH